jgi:hypothetical protein
VNAHVALNQALAGRAGLPGTPVTALVANALVAAASVLEHHRGDRDVRATVTPLLASLGHRLAELAADTREGRAAA